MNPKQFILDFLAKAGKIDDKIKEKMADVDIEVIDCNVRLLPKLKMGVMNCRIEFEWKPDEPKTTFQRVGTSANYTTTLPKTEYERCPHCNVQLPRLSGKHWCMICGMEIK